MRGWGAVSILFMIGLAILGEVVIPDDGKASFQPIYMGRWPEKRALAVDEAEAEAALSPREGQRSRRDGRRAGSTR